jgi:hypothetical protein
MVHAEIDTQLVLVSARKSRGADHWDKDDYDVRLERWRDIFGRAQE